METNVQSQLWFCLGSPLGWSEVGTPFSLAFHSGFACSVSQRWKFPLSVFNLSVISDMGQMTVANHSEPFVLSCLNRLIGYFIFAKLATHTPTWPQLGQEGSELYTASFLCFFPFKTVNFCRLCASRRRNVCKCCPTLVFLMNGTVSHSTFCSLGLYNFCDHGIADVTAELASKNGIYCQMWNITELTVIGLKVCFWQKKEGWPGKIISRGCSCVWDHPCVTWQTLPNNVGMSKQLPEKPEK